MDVGQDNFRFTLDDPEKRSKAIRYPMSTELHVNSLDRITQVPYPYTTVYNTPSQAFAQLNVGAQWRELLPSTDCLIKTKRALLYGYFNRVGMSEFQLNYNVPTVVTGVNDIFRANVYIANNPTPESYIEVIIPEKYWTPQQLADYLQAQIRATAGPGGTPYAGYTVTHPINQQEDPTTGQYYTGFSFSTNNSDTWALTYEASQGVAEDPSSLLRIAKFNRLIGGNNRQSFGLAPTGDGGTYTPTSSFRTFTPNWLQTDYVDIVSKALTNYKESKDTNTNVQAPLGVIGRIYLSDFATAPQNAVWNEITGSVVWGTAPIKFTKKWTTVNWSQWSPNQSIDQIDIQLLDMWGERVFWNTNYQTEWQMTLVASE